jgi:Fic family protein
MNTLEPLTSLSPARFSKPEVLVQLTKASRALAELKGLALSIPNQSILIQTLSMREAKESSEIENIVTSHDELFTSDVSEEVQNSATKEVLRYRQAIGVGFELVKENNILTTNDVIQIHRELACTRSGLRTIPGTVIVNSLGEVIYRPPQNAEEIKSLMHDLEKFLNEPSWFGVDPLIKMAIQHYQFESIHPFYDGNGRTGRILNVLYLVQQDLLSIPILYLSKYILRHRMDYYNLLQQVRTDDFWEKWVVYMLEMIEQASVDAIAIINQIRVAMAETKTAIRSSFKFYSQDLINSLYMHPYTKIQLIAKELGVTRITATRYLSALESVGILKKETRGRTNYFINNALVEIITQS